MKIFHLIFGLILFVLFLVTGQLMYYHYPDKLVIEEEFRLLMRSRHIYILFNSLIHMLVGAFMWKVEKWRYWIQKLGSGFLTIGSALLVAGFFVEVFEYGKYSDISALGVQATFAGTLGFLICAKRQSKE